MADWFWRCTRQATPSAWAALAGVWVVLACSVQMQVALHAWPGMTGGSFPVTAALSNQALSSYVGPVQVAHNTVCAPIFSWTNLGAFPSTTRSLRD